VKEFIDILQKRGTAVYLVSGGFRLVRGGREGRSEGGSEGGREGRSIDISLFYPVRSVRATGGL
jgi:hypothetical protein